MTGFVNKRVLYPLYVLSATSWISVLILRFRLRSIRSSGMFWQYQVDPIIRWIQIFSICGIVFAVLSIILHKLCNAIDDELLERDKKLIALERALKELREK